LHLRQAHLPGGRAPAWSAAASARRDLFVTPVVSPLERERRALERFGWVDRAQGLVHVPIDVAMELVAGGKP
jgi:hypothetical protein